MISLRQDGACNLRPAQSKRCVKCYDTCSVARLKIIRTYAMPTYSTYVAYVCALRTLATTYGGRSSSAASMAAHDECVAYCLMCNV